uniref:Deleted in malignant brain tumors 1 protein n=1 Tax=Amphimedon queenslandica TaxID=400682 RepID=A0A1X7U1B7_AMPQE
MILEGLRPPPPPQLLMTLLDGNKMEEGSIRDGCNHSDIRLVGGSNANEGRVEVCINGAWGTVCDDLWGAPDAAVVCNQLGIDGTSIARTNAYFGAGTGPINMDNVQCTGNEGFLVNCTYLSTHNCAHFEDAGVTCGGTPQCNNSDIRLVGGSNDNEGRVEVCQFYQWGTVCDDSWGFPDAQVACRQLGLPSSGAVAYGSAYFGQGSGAIALDDMQCTGNESSLFNCTYNPNHNCVHFEDAGVLCQSASCNSTAVRLVNGLNDTEGRVEVCLNGAWGTVCDDFWSTNDAVVVCNQLGYNGSLAAAIGNAYFGLGTGPINMDNVFCSGTESQLTDCSYSAIHNCGHSEDASVICVPRTANCTDGEVRLVGGQNYTEGRVEICLNGEWGTACDDLWGNEEAQVVCRQLGFPHEGSIAHSSATYGQGIGPIHLDDVQCTGSESSLLACSYAAIDNCGHSEDAGVQCLGQGTECTHGSVRLVGGSNATEGRVEVCINGFWGTVCDDSWGTPDARVVCNQLGYASSGAQALSFAAFGAGSGRINMDDVQCTGTEAFLVNCTYNPDHNCAHFEDASVRCSEAECNETDIRLVGGSNYTEGRVEVCVGGRWGTICDDSWGNEDARVVCRQLGYEWEGAIAYSFAHFGQGSGPINLDDVQCTGNELLITDCPYNPNHNCNHFEDAGVTCAAAPNECNHTDIRLVGGSNATEGRVEVCINGAWGTVCDDLWGAPDAAVVCRQLGISGNAIARTNAYFGAGTGPINMDNVQCTGNEGFLVNCSYLSIHNCGHSEDAGVTCGVQPECNHSDIRLVGGSNANEGRVEVCINGAWGTVCDDLWGSADAAVVCNQLGISGTSIARTNAYFGAGTGPINMDNVQCTGNEGFLVNCTYLSIHNCGHFEDAGVTCGVQPECNNTDIRLVGGSNANEGRVEVCRRVEVCLNARWGTVCDDLWGATDARVVCRQLGYEWEGAIAHSLSYFGQGSGPINLDNVQCTGNELLITDCPYVANHNCIHLEDAGVTCQASPNECNDTDIRLVGGSNANEGRVEVCINGAWGTVCDDLWGVTDAAVVCNQLGIAGVAIARTNAYFGAGTGPINMDNVQCTGNEGLLINCTYLSDHNCVHFEDAGVTCGATIQCNNSDIRLVGGSNDNEGRVEVCQFNQWGTVCDDSWNAPDAQVACRQLGLPFSGAVAYGSAYFGLGSGAIILDDMQCIGNESSLFNCTYNPNHNCIHFEDAGVLCQAATCNSSVDSVRLVNGLNDTEDAGVTCGIQPSCNHGDIRLVGGSNDNEGRVEVCINGVWGTVCDDIWDSYDATVVCNQLGINGLATARTNAYFGAGTGPINMDNVQCTGNEGFLVNCTYLSTHNCIHQEDAGVTCGGVFQCNNSDIRLVGSDSLTEGRVEVCVNGAWGTVCDDFWDYRDAQVACKQLGLPFTGAVAYGSAFYGQGTGPIVLDNVGCAGTEGSLFNCTYLANHNCVHFEDAGVMCQSASCNSTAVRLVNGLSETEGRVEVCLNGAWGTVCDDFWSTNDAVVVCNQLGYNGSLAIAVGNAYFGLGTGPINMDNVFCTGTESQLTNCFHLTTHNCIHSEDASVICAPQTANCSEGEIRLVGGQNNTEGRVEICLNGQWGTVCHDLWDNTDAQVVCRQLGFSTDGALANSNAQFGQGTGNIHLDNVQCNGSESSLLACSYASVDNCVHAQDAGVQCGFGNECVEGQVKLVGGLVATEGRIEVCIGGYWGTVCDDFWTYEDASVVCRQLGFEYAGAQALTFAAFGVGSGPIYLDDVQCIGNETGLLNCTYNPNHNCIHYEDAAVRCAAAECNETDVRLVGGSNYTEGRVEVCLGGRWGTVCDDFWGVTDARVVCRQLGYEWEGSYAYSFSYFGQGSGPIVMDNLQCTGSESALTDCPFDPDVSDCTHLEDSGVMCLPSPRECNESDIRLVGGANATEGRVEVCIFGEWGTVCDDLWSIQDAVVVCAQLGYPTASAQARGNAYFGQGTGRINMDNVQCTGSEDQLTSCTFLADHNCIHSEDAGVICGEAECEKGDIRLVSGSTPYEGLVQVCYNGIWGTVCDDYWSTLDAMVVCGQLGYSTMNALAYSNSYFGSVTGPINLDDVQCSGNEESLLDCPFNPQHNCLHSEDAGVMCLELSPSVSPTVAPLGSCGLAGFTECCNTSVAPNCFGETQNCYCDYTCYEFGDCCDDIADIGCTVVGPTPTPNAGSCVSLGFNGCCSLSNYPSCIGSDGICFCDISCYLFGDCCSDIQNIGCYATTSIPTSTSAAAGFSTSSLATMTTSAVSPTTIAPSTVTSGITSTLLVTTTSAAQSSTPQPSTTPVQSSTAQSSTPLQSSTQQPSSTPVQSSTAQSSTPVQSSTPQPSSTPVQSSTAQSSTPVQSSTPQPSSTPVQSSTAQSSTPVQSSTPQQPSSTPVQTSTAQSSSSIQTGTSSSTTLQPSTAATVPTSVLTRSSSIQSTPVQTTSIQPSSTPGPTATPGPVQNISVTINNDNSATVTWILPQQGAQFISSYDVQVTSTGNGISFNKTVYATGIRSATFDSLTPYVPYIATITPFNTVGRGTPQTSDLFFTAQGAPSIGPANVVLTRVSDTSINVTWTPLTLSQARGEITFYQVTYEPVDRADSPVSFNVSGSTSSAVLNNLRDTSKYRVSVAAFTEIGIGPATTVSETSPTAETSANNAGAIAGSIIIVLVVVAVLAIVAILVVVFIRRYNHGKFSPSTDHDLQTLTDKGELGVGGDTYRELSDDVSHSYVSQREIAKAQEAANANLDDKEKLLINDETYEL